MSRGLILHAALLLANIGVLLGMAYGPIRDNGEESGRFNPAHSAHYADTQAAAEQLDENAARPAVRPGLSTGNELATTLASLRAEQAKMRDEIKQLKSSGGTRQHVSTQNAEDGHCHDNGDNAPGVTVYLETAPNEAPAANSDKPGRQWTAVSFKEVGTAPDGSKQAVMSIQKTEVKNGSADFVPVRNTPHWQ
jgi:hypothetical protein